MSAIFISHSSRDAAAAAEVRKRLAERGYTSVFLDFDPEDGIPAGVSWEAELYHRLRVSRAVLALCSAQSTASRWCFAEITQAKALGKPIFPLKVGPCSIDAVLMDRQVTDLTVDPDLGYQRLWRGLEQAGLDPGFDIDPDRVPYPGLNAFGEADAPFFFGREDEIAEVSEVLARMRRFGEPRMAVVLGASGSGKSSLLRAGVVPRLRKDPERWIVVPPIRPGDRPFDALAQGWAEAFGALGVHADPRELRDRLRAGGESWRSLAAELADAGHREASVLLVLDQFEELLGHGSSEEVEDFSGALRGALGGRSAELLAVATLRTDFFASFQRHPRLAEIPFATLPLGPLTRGGLRRVIEEPAALKGIEVEPELTRRMVEDSLAGDALPLLAFVLRELYERRAGPRLTLSAYAEDLGGIQGAVARAAGDIVDVARLRPDEEKALRSAFLRMVRVAPDGRFSRQKVSVDRLSPAVQPLITRLVQGRLLVAGAEGEEEQVEVAHEALFAAWPPLARWLDEERAFLLWRRQLEERRSDWLRHERDDGSLMQGAALDEARRWLADHDQELDPPEREFIDRSLTADRRRRRKRRLVRAGGLAAAGLVVVLGGVAVQQQRGRAAADLIASARRLAIEAELLGGRDAEVLQRRALLAAAALRRFDAQALRSVEADQALRHALSLLPSQVDTFQTSHPVDALAFSPDGSRLTLVVRAPRVALIRQLDTGSEVARLPLPDLAERASLVSLSPEGRYVAAAVEGTNVDPRGSAIVWEIESGRLVGSVPFSGSASVLLLGPDGGSLVLKATGEPALGVWELGENRLVGQLEVAGARVVLSPDGRYLAVAGRDGGVWQIAGVRGATRLERFQSFPSPADVRAVAFGADGGLLASIDRRSLRLELRSLPGWEEGRDVSLPDGITGLEPLALSPDGRYVAFATTSPGGGSPERGDVVVQSLLSGEEARIEVAGPRQSLAFSPSGAALAMADATGSTYRPRVAVWGISAGTHTGEIQVEGRVERMRFVTTDGESRLSVVSSSGAERESAGRLFTFGLYEPPDGSLSRPQWRQEGTYLSTYSPDGHQLALVIATGEVQLRRVADGEVVHHFPYQGRAEAIALSPDGGRLVVAGGGRVRLWTLPSGSESGWTYGGSAVAIRILPEGGELVVREERTVGRGTRGERIEVLETRHDLQTGAPLAEARTVLASRSPAAAEAGFSEPVFRAEITSPETVAVRAPDGTEVARIEETDPLEHAAVSEDGGFLATAAGTRVRIWPLFQRDLADLACRRLTRAFTEEELRAYFGGADAEVCPEAEA